MCISGLPCWHPTREKPSPGMTPHSARPRKRRNRMNPVLDLIAEALDMTIPVATSMPEIHHRAPNFFKAIWEGISRRMYRKKNAARPGGCKTRISYTIDQDVVIVPDQYYRLHQTSVYRFEDRQRRHYRRFLCRENTGDSSSQRREDTELRREPEVSASGR